MTSPSVQTLLDHLAGVKETTDGQYTARCPAHDDRVQSLSVGVGDDGAALIHCHAGCATEHVVKSMGLTMSDLFPKGTSRNGERRVITTFDYVDERGSLLFQVARYEPKDFRQRRPDGQGAWIWNVKGLRRVLYRLPDLLKADTGSIVYVVEGEKDVDRLRACGMIATCNPGGAGKWPKVDDSPLHGRQVCIIPDKDKSGINHAQQVAAALHGKAASVRVLDALVEIEHGDVSDFLDAGGDPEDLDRMAKETPAWEPSANHQAGRLVIVRLSDVQPERINWLWRNRIPRDKVSVLGGMAGLGKTFATLDMASRVSTGEPWPDLPDDPIEVGSVVILNLEDGLGDTIRPRLDAMGANLDKIVAVEGVYEIDKQGRRMFNITQDVHHLELVIEQLGDARLVILDPLTAYIGSKLDSWRDNEVRAVLYPLGELAKRCKVAVVGVMHVRKSPSDKAMFRVLGSVAFTAYARAVWLIGEDRDSDDPDCRLLLPVKLNIARAAPGLRFRITDRGVVEWLGDTDTTADEAFAPADPEDAGPKVKSAIEWLKGVLADGAQAAMAIKAQARENCIAARTLDRAKSRLKVVASNEGVFGQAWYWSLPESKP